LFLSLLLRPLFLPLLLLWRLIILLVLRPIRPRTLRESRQSQHGTQRRQPSCELEFPFHFPLHLLTLIGVARIIVGRLL